MLDTVPLNRWARFLKSCKACTEMKGLVFDLHQAQPNHTFSSTSLHLTESPLPAATFILPSGGDFTLIFHNTSFNMRRSRCYSFAPPAYEILPILAASRKRRSQSSPSNVSYNLLQTIWPLKRKIAFNISSLWKTTTIKRYNCNAAASVSTWPGQLLGMTGGWGAFKSAL